MSYSGNMFNMREHDGLNALNCSIGVWKYVTCCMYLINAHLAAICLGSAALVVRMREMLILALVPWCKQYFRTTIANMHENTIVPRAIPEK